MLNKMYCDLCGAKVATHNTFIYKINEDEDFALLRRKHSGTPCLFTPYVCDNCQNLLTDICNLLQDNKKERLKKREEGNENENY